VTAFFSGTSIFKGDSVRAFFPASLSYLLFLSLSFACMLSSMVVSINNCLIGEGSVIQINKEHRKEH
jgi:hypothetical protein